ncbi:MAG: hypothetical protein HZB65_00940 [Candidatus Aenigmarchaeota archaeon]|nr:hypothetical protein [Candidatus Aenigmarchaeota archaeon]
MEQKIYLLSQGAKHKIITFDIIESWNLCSENVLKVAIHNLLKKGLFFSLKKGVYVIQPPFTKEIVIEDPFYTAQSLFNGYIGFSSALYIYKLMDEIPFTIFISTRNHSLSKKIGEYEYKAVSLGDRFSGYVQKDNYLVSNLPKTFFDCFYIPEYSGGYSNILRAVYRAKMTDKEWYEFLYYCKQEGSAFYQRVGYLLSLLKKPIPILKELKKHTKTAVKLDPKTGNGTLNKEWKVIDNIGKKQLMSWWYHGGA